MRRQPTHFSRIDLFAERRRQAVDFLTFYAVDRGVEVGIGELRFQRRLCLVPSSQFFLQLLDFLEQWPPLRE